MLGNPFGNQMGGMGGYGSMNVSMGNSPLSFMGKNKNPGLGDTGSSMPMRNPGVSMMPGNTPVQLGAGMPWQGGGNSVGIPPGSAISRLHSMMEMPNAGAPQQRNAPQGNPMLGSMLPANQQMLPMGQGQKNQASLQNQGSNPWFHKIQGMMPQNFAQNPQLGGLLQNPQTLAALMRSRY